MGIDISEEYCELAQQRIAQNQSNMVTGFKNVETLRPKAKMEKTQELIW